MQAQREVDVMANKMADAMQDNISTGGLVTMHGTGAILSLFKSVPEGLRGMVYNKFKQEINHRGLVHVS